MSSENKPKCFVIQTFDNGVFDRRYHETIKPALIKADVVPVRADEILGPKPIIEKIENTIRESDICLAEISTDNPNVWLEVGYAYSLQKPTLLLCDKKLRSDLPFDIRHRPVIFYTTEYLGGFQELERRILIEIGEFVKQSKNYTPAELPVKNIPSITIDSLGIESQLLMFLLLDAQVSDPNGMSGWQIKNAWDTYNLGKEKISFAVATLLSKGFLNEGIARDYDNEEYKIYTLTQQAMIWVASHPELYDVVAQISRAQKPKVLIPDEIPF